MKNKDSVSINTQVFGQKSLHPRESIQPVLVTAKQMQAVESRLFSSGMPVAALMEKVSGLVVQWFLTHAVEAQLISPSIAGRNVANDTNQIIGILAGPGHNGGDALVVARELYYLGYSVRVYQPFANCKSLTSQHANYAKSLGICFVEEAVELFGCSAIIDGWFGFGLTRPILDKLQTDIQSLNRQNIPIFSIDLPSGIHTDTGQVMGIAIEASYTACLGLWKRAFMQERAIAYFGKTDLIDFDIPLADIEAVVGQEPKVQRITDANAIAYLPLQRSATAHKYKAGHLLLIAGSRQYAGAALLAGLGAVASGVGMLTIAIPDSIRLSLLPQLPGALLVGCPETNSGAIRELPEELTLEKYDVITFGPGLTTAVPSILEALLSFPIPLLLDADGLNLLAQKDASESLQKRAAPTILTPHLGEFKRLFPDIHQEGKDSLPGEIAQQAAQASGATILLKGPKSAIAANQTLWFNPHSTPALARGGSGDVLTGLMGGLLASCAHSQQWKSNSNSLTPAVLSAVWWHSQAAIYASQERTLLGVDPLHLAQALNPALQQLMS